MKTRLVLALLLVSLAALSACDQDAMMSSKGFRLPDGNAVAGRDVFLYMQCHSATQSTVKSYPFFRVRNRLTSNSAAR